MRLFVASVALLALPQIALAVLPPDILFSVGTQLWQIVVGVGALVVGSITAIFPFLRGVSIQKPRLRPVLITMGIGIVLLGLVYLLFITQARTVSVLPVLSPTSTSSPQHEFFSNRFVLLGTKENGEKILMNLDFNRKETAGGEFMHYYFIDIINGDKISHQYVERQASTSHITSDIFFTTFTRTTAEDHSAREEYNFDFVDNAHQYRVGTELLTSDFLIKNEPEYTAYISVGTATAMLDEEEIAFKVMAERIYSTDYRTSVFFDPEGTLKSESVQMVLWDEDGDFYLADRSLVDGYSSAYASHFWALWKGEDGLMRRYFEGVATATTSKNDVNFLATFGASDDMQIKVRLRTPFEELGTEGYVLGTLSYGGRSVDVEGFAKHKYYGPR